MATKTISNWNPFGVGLNITATSGTVTRTAADKFTVVLNVSWKTYYSGNKTNYGMTASSGGKSATINPFGTKAASGSGTLTGTYTISGNGSATKTIDVVFRNFNSDNGDSATKTISLSVSVPAWTSYAVTFNANGGSGAPAKQTKWKNQALTLSSTKPTRTGYTFQGWGTSSTDTTVDYAAGGTVAASVNKALALYAIWKINTWKVTFNANEGTGGPTSQTKTYGTTLTLTTSKPTRTGYDFKEWNTKKDGSGTSYKSGGSYTANAAVTLYAIWTKKTYKVTFNANGGSGAPASQTKTHDVTLKLSTSVPTKENYTFKGWSTSASSATVSYSAGGNYTNNANVTLYAVWELSYKNPTIANIQLSRCDANGNPVGDDVELTSALLSFKWTTYRAVSKIEFSWMSASGEIVNWKEVAVQVGGRTGTVSEIFGANLLPADETFNITIWVYDDMGYAWKEVTLEGYLFTIDMLGGGKGVSFGKPAELEDTADFNFETLYRKRAVFNNNTSIYGTTLDGDIKEVMNPQNTNGNLVIGYGNYAEEDGDSNLYGHNVHLGISDVAGGVDKAVFVTPYRNRSSAAMTLTLKTTGWITNGKKEVTFLVPFAVPIIGNPTITVASGNGFILRQNDMYTHGSAWIGETSSYTYAFPDSYSVAIIPYNGLQITAKFTDVTNAVNNSPIGINWNGTITFS